ncbi:MAG TPA: erythromycin esterase family protein [Candidatus Limnocylindria bacterium]|nr:erythromycin esterase family protein [Candidatus Limnocylindria bacterium]
MIGDARVVAIGESSHYNREFLQLRHRLTRYLVERHGFGAVAMESGFVEGWLADTWVRGGPDDDRAELGHVMANGLTSLMGLWSETRALLEWLRQRPAGFYGIDLGGSNVSLLPGLDAISSYLAEADPEFRVDQGIRETAAAFSAGSPFGIPAAMSGYPGLAPERRDALTAGLADLRARMIGRRLEYLPRTGVERYERALRSVHLTVAIDAMFRDLARGDQRAMMLTREAAIADTVEWILRREDRIVVHAHDGHVQRCPGSLPGISGATTMGTHLADRLGSDYVAIGTTSATGQTLSDGPDFLAGRLFAEMGPPERGSLDALMAASHDGPFAADLRRLSPDDTAQVRAASRQRFGSYYSEQNPLDAFDAVVHLPNVTAAEPDKAAIAASPEDVQKAFAS